MLTLAAHAAGDDMVGRATAALLCAAVVGVTSAAGRAQPGWTVQHPPSPAGSTAATLTAVSCAGGGWCTAVGSYTGGDATSTLAERWTAGAWRIAPTPNPSGANLSYLTGVSCVSSHWCMAVGAAGVSTPHRFTEQVLAELWNGQRWTIQTTPDPGGRAALASLAAVSCTSADACLAVGGWQRGTVNAQAQPFAERWTGTSWVSQPLANPHAENGSTLSGVSCAAAGACTASGNYDYADVDQSIFAERWNGKDWTRQHQPNPVGQQLNTETALSCPGQDRCLAVGSWTDSAGDVRTLAELWDGTSWRSTTSVAPKGAEIAALAAVSCPSTTDCLAVGFWSTNGNELPEYPLAEVWNGSSWTRQPVPQPTRARASQLVGVSCPSQTACTAVGNFWNGHATRPLAEAYTG